MSVNEAADGWGAFNTVMATARKELISAAPDADSRIEAEAYLMRVMTQSLNDAFLNHLLTEKGLSRALPTKGGPNPQYIIFHAAIDATRRYRLHGQLNDSERVGAGLYAFTSTGAALLTSYAAFDSAKSESGGNFVLDIAADATGPGALTIKPGARVLMIRVLHRNPLGRSCSLALEGGNAANDLALAGGTTEKALAQAGNSTLRAVRQFLQWSHLTSASPNRFTSPPPNIAEETQGDPDTTYILGYYDLHEGEYLEALLTAPSNGYWSLQAYNHWCEALPNASVDDRTSVIDDDNMIRISIGPNLSPAVANRLDTLGRYRGVLILRYIGEAEMIIPQTTVRRA